MASLYDFGFNPRTMFIDEEGQIRLKNPDEARAMLAANEPNFDLTNYIMSTKNQNNEPVFSNPGEAELEPTFQGNYGDSNDGFIDAPDAKNKFNILEFLPFGEKSLSGSLLRGIGSLVPKMDPRQSALREFYGVDDIGRVSSGLMKDYNPVSGGGLYTLTGGKFGEPPTYGLQNAYQKRMDRIEKTLTGDKYGLDQDAINAIYAGTYDEEDDNFDTSLIKRLQDLNAAKAAELEIIQANTPGDSNDGFIDTSSQDNKGGKKYIGGGGSGVPDQIGGNQFKGDSGPTTQQEADYGYASDYGFKRGGLASLL
tara:strand:+ start:10478 stop:11407 length:930 start_codon:yes stop_codon:yes gene_type:complete